MNSPLTAIRPGTTGPLDGRNPSRDEVVELGILLTSRRAEALLELSRRRNQSVGQLLRSLIDEAIRDG